MIFSGVDNVYAFRANVAANAVNIYKSSATAGFWCRPQRCELHRRGNATPMDGDTLTQVRQRPPSTGHGGSGTIAGSMAAGTFVVTTPNLGFSAGPATTRRDDPHAVGRADPDRPSAGAIRVRQGQLLPASSSRAAFMAAMGEPGI